jgi:hypothetical protein
MPILACDSFSESSSLIGIGAPTYSKAVRLMACNSMLCSLLQSLIFTYCRWHSGYAIFKSSRKDQVMLNHTSAGHFARKRVIFPKSDTKCSSSFCKLLNPRKSDGIFKHTKER